MKYGMPRVVLLISLVACSAFAEGQAPKPDPTDQAISSGESLIWPAPRSSWESWLSHGGRESTPAAQVPSHNLGLAPPAASLSSHTGLESGLIEPEPPGVPSRLNSMEIERRGHGMSGSGR